MFSTGNEFSLLLLFTLSLFLASQCYDIPLLELQRCQIKCFERDYNTTEEHICVMLCHERYLQELAKRENGQNPQVEDPKKLLKQCQRGCSSLYEGAGQRQQKQLCLQHCRDQYEDQKKAQEEREKRGGGGVDAQNPRVSPEQQDGQCQHRCQFRAEEEERKTCREHCKEEYSKERGREAEGNLLGKKKEEEKHEKNPYFFEGHRFESRFRSEEGHFRVLQRFSERSELLKGIDNYRLAIFEANPSTLTLPHHRDADAVFVVAKGQAIITFVHQKWRESFNLQRGDAIVVHAGLTVYLINPDDNEKLQILQFLHPINTPGHFEEFFGAGGKDPQSFYRVFSKGLLEAALNLPKDRFEGFFERQENGTVIKISQEQIRALTQIQQAGSAGQGEWGESGSSSQGQWGESGSSRQGQGGGSGSSSQGQGGESGSASQEQGGESRGPFNILQQLPLFANQYGQFFEASPDTNEQLRRLDISVAFLNISQGAMMVPYHNTRSTKMMVAVGGKGECEVACPHVARRSQDSKGKKEKEHERRRVQYKKISARFSVGDALIIPAGHPISIIASRDENLQLVGFGVNARGNGKHFLAGSENIWNQVPSEAKAISFDAQATEADEIFGSQPNAYFVPGPKQSLQEEEERGHSVASVLDFLGIM